MMTLDEFRKHLANKGFKEVYDTHILGRHVFDLVLPDNMHMIRIIDNADSSDYIPKIDVHIGKKYDYPFSDVGYDITRDITKHWSRNKRTPNKDLRQMVIDYIDNYLNNVHNSRSNSSIMTHEKFEEFLMKSGFERSDYNKRFDMYRCYQYEYIFEDGSRIMVTDAVDDMTKNKVIIEFTSSLFPGKEIEFKQTSNGKNDARRAAIDYMEN